MINSLPTSLVLAALKLVETKDVLKSCVSCGAVAGSCVHSDLEEEELEEDNLTALDIQGEDEPEEQLSGDSESVIINPEYLTFTHKRPSY
jgi:hypothetical protein